MEKNTPVYEAPDLLYPDAQCREELNRRRLALNRDYPCTYLNDLMTESVASMICRRNPQNVMKLFREMCTDTRVINYRLDAIEDLMNNPSLSPVLHKAADMLLESSHRTAGISTPDSFDSLSGCIEALELYIDCMDILSEHYNKTSDNIRSEAFKKLFDDIMGRVNSDDYAELKRNVTELKDAITKKIRSVTVAINFNADMKPVSAGIVGWSEKQAGEKPSVFDRLFYKNAAHPDVYVAGKLRSALPNQDGYLSEADKALFDALEKVTSAYMGRLEAALRSYERLSFDYISMMNDRLEIYDGMVKIIEAARARGLQMCRPVFTDGPTHIRQLFDPCFFFKAAAARHELNGDELVVRNDISMDETGSFFILTGANNGGKTTFVRGVGLCFLMAQTGFYVPASSFEAAPCDFIYTHFPKEEETGINASRFTTEIKDLKVISDLITGKSLLLMNESIQSTTPIECEEISEELVRIFCILGVRGIFATHITGLASKCASIADDPDCRSKPASIVAQTEDESGRRLYRITRGEPPKRSHAADIFRSFGISADEIRKKADRRGS